MIIYCRLSVMTMVMIIIQGCLNDAFTQTQNKYCLSYKSGDYCPPVGVNIPENKSLRKGQREYVLIQFYEIPDEDIRKGLENAGILLLKYVPNYAYWSSVKRSLSESEIKAFKIRSIERIKPEHKIDNKIDLNKNISVRSESELELTYFEGANIENLKSSLANLGARVIKESPLQNSLIVRIASGRIKSLGAIPEISFIMPAPPKPEPSNFTSLNQHRNNVLQSELAGQRGLSGDGITVGIDDEGAIGIHQDLKPMRLLNLSPPANNNHATHVAGTVGGSGNIQPRAKGMAFNVNYVAQSFPELINNGPTYYNNYSMTLTNNSYGYLSYWGVYDNSSNYTDKTQDNINSPGLLHVVATHNGGGAGFKTVSSGWATAKNVLSVGSVNEHDEISGFSGKGPVNDGRMKPEIVGLGESVYSTIPDNGYVYMSGTSMACPGVTGTIALLYQRFQQLKGSRPNSDIMKALVCNTADDIGNSGPDFSTGFGRINSKRAVEALEANNYIESNVSNGQTITHSITVPSGTGQLRILLYWKDKEGAEFSAVNLVNNLDIQVTKTPNTYLPWVLNPADPNQTAGRGIDNLNNIEQVTVDNPDAGTYTLSVKGTTVPFGPQRYVIAYEFVKPFLNLTFPFGGESLIPGEFTQIRWDAFGTGNYNVEYSINNGSSWLSIASDIPASQHYLDWYVPSVAASALVRISSGIYSSQSHQNFSIFTVPSNLRATTPTTGSIKFEWDAVPEAASYDVYLLEAQDKVIEFEANTINTSYVFQNRPIGLSNEVWMSVRAKTSSGIISERAYAIRKVAVEVQGVCNASGTITREVWNSVTGSLVSNIPVNRTPSSVSTLNIFEAPTNYGTNYGQRVRGYICPPQTGNYVFWISSNDNSELWLSTSDNPENRVRIAYVTGFTGIREWTKYPSQRSAPISLTAGKSYYIEALHKQGANSDNLAVGWQLPDGTLERPIPGNRLSPFGITPPPPPGQHGLLGVYFKDVSFGQVGHSRVDSTVNFNFGVKSPAPNIGADKFSIRWTGKVEAVYTETYTFYTTSNDGVRLKINGVQLINNFRDHPATENSGKINLVAGQKYDVELEYYENVGSSIITMSWSSASQVKQIIPYERLTPAESQNAVAAYDLPPTVVNILVYPNPADYHLFVWAPQSDTGDVHIELIDMNAKQHLSETFTMTDTSYPIELDISQVPNGLYLFVIQTKSFKETRRFSVIK